MPLHDKHNRLLKPTTKKGGSWLSAFEASPPSLTARAVRCITGHTPIGEYYHRMQFNLPAPHCACGRFGTRSHILCSCRKYKHYRRHPWDTWELYKYLNANLLTFSFAAIPPSCPWEEEGVG